MSRSLTLPTLRLPDDEPVVQFFEWHNRWGQTVPYALTTRRIFVLAEDPDGDWIWQQFYDFADLGRGRKVAADRGKRLYVDIEPPRTLRFDGLTIEEV